MTQPFFSDKENAKKAGRKGGKSVRPENRYFSVNREAAAAGGRKSRYVKPKPRPVPDDTLAKAEFERVGGEYARLMPWEMLSESLRAFWRKQVSAAQKGPILVQNQGNSST